MLRQQRLAHKLWIDTLLHAAEKLTEEEARAMLQDLQLAAPADEGPLVGLLSRWAARGRQESPEPQVRLTRPLPACEDTLKPMQDWPETLSLSPSS